MPVLVILALAPRAMSIGGLPMRRFCEWGDVMADFEMVFRRDRHVAAVEQRMQIAADEDAVIGLVASVFGKGFDVGGVEDGEKRM